MGQLKLPLTCMPVFLGLSIFLISTVYLYTFAPMFWHITSHPHGASQLRRVSHGLAISIISVAWAPAFERYIRNYAFKHDYEFLFLSAMPNLSAYCLLLQYFLIGIADVFCIVGLLEFLYEEASDAMRSIGSAYAAVAGGLCCFVATVINKIVKSIMVNKAKGHVIWLSQNINQGRFDYFYWLLMVLNFINICVFLFFAQQYKYLVRSLH